MQELMIPPHSIKIEQSLIGALLLNNKVFDEISDIVSQSDFYRDDHGRIFRHISALISKDIPADILTVSDSIIKSNEEDQTGGLAYLAEIANSVPSSAFAKRYAETIRENAQKRDLIAIGSEISSLGFSLESVSEAVDKAQGLLIPLSDFGISKSEPKAIQEIVGRALADIEAAYERGGGLAGISSGFVDLDKRLGGLCSGDMIVLAGRPSSGKTAWALNIAENVALNNGNVLFFSLEMGDIQLAKRSMASLGGIDLGSIIRGKLDETDWDKMTVALQKIHGMKMHIDETPALSISNILSRSRRHLRKTGKIDLIVIDYMQLIKPSRSKTANSRNDEVTEISAGIKMIAKTIGCPVIALSQLSRKVEERADKRPIMSDLRESGAIEQDADVIITMYRDEYYNRDSPFKGLAEANVVKHRNGETGTVVLTFEGQYSRFRNADQYAIENIRQQQPARKPRAGFSD